MTEVAAVCPVCRGNKVLACTECAGRGWNQCDHCGGSGVHDADCPNCHGTFHTATGADCVPGYNHHSECRNSNWRGQCDHGRLRCPSPDDTVPNGTIVCPNCHGTGTVAVDEPDPNQPVATTDPNQPDPDPSSGSGAGTDSPAPDPSSGNSPDPDQPDES
jgi:hypothetical protein